MEKEKLEKFRRLLLEKKRQILSRYLEQEEIVKKLTEEGLTVPEDIEDFASKDLTELLIGYMELIEIELLREIDKALDRIEEGTYGYCEVCGKPIEEKRLEAVPWTTLCKEHAEEMERERKIQEALYLKYFETFNPPKDFKLSDDAI